MTFHGERYYKLYRILLTCLGLWPYRKPFLLQTVFMFCALLCGIICQLITLFTKSCTFYNIITQLSYTFPIVIYFILYCLFYFNTVIVKQMIERIKADWSEVQGINEMEILKTYALKCYILNVVFVILIIFCLVVLVILELTPIILDTVAPLNETRPRKLKVDFELFLDEQQYYYVYVIFEVTVISVAYMTLISTGTTLLAIITHFVATFKISSYLIENIVTKKTLQVSADVKVRLMFNRLSRAVRIHKNSIQFYTLFVKNINKWFIATLVMGVLSLSCNFFRILNAATLLKEFTELLVCSSVIIFHFVIMFIGNFFGQIVMDHSTEVFHAAYNTIWYLAPLPVQKLLLIIMQHTLKPNTIVLGSFFVASFEGFSTLLTTSISYFTVIYSVN